MSLLDSLIVFYGTIVAGYVAKRIKIFKYGEEDILVKFVFYITYPLLVLYSLVTIPLEEILSSAILMVGYSIYIHIIIFVITILIVSLLKLPKPEKGVIVLTSTFLNAIFLPLPLSAIFLGNIGVIFVTFFAVPALILFNVIGVIIGVYYSESEEQFSIKSVFNALLRFPPLWAILIGGIILLLGIELPMAILQFSKSLGDVTVPVILFAVGVKIRLDLPKLHLVVIGLVSVLRLVVSPLITLATLTFFSISKPEFFVIFLESIMPPAVANAAFATIFKLDDELTAKVVSSVTLFSIIILLVVLPYIIP